MKTITRNTHRTAWLDPSPQQHNRFSSSTDAASAGTTHLSLLNILGRYLLGNHMAMAHMSTHRMANSSSIWPRKLRVAWKYVEPMPEREKGIRGRLVRGQREFMRGYD